MVYLRDNDLKKLKGSAKFISVLGLLTLILTVFLDVIGIDVDASLVYLYVCIYGSYVCILNLVYPVCTHEGQ